MRKRSALSYQHMDPSRIATEKLVSRPVQRMDVENGGVLSSRFGVRIHLGQHLISLLESNLESRLRAR